MSFQDIKIVRKIPIVNGFVVAPDALESNRSLETAVSILESNTDVMDGVELNGFEAGGPVGLGVGTLAGPKFGKQRWLELDVPFGDLRGKQIRVVNGNHQIVP